MKTYEVAAVKCAVKRSVKSRSVEVGYNHLLKWFSEWKDTCDTILAMKCFRSWAKRQSF